MTLNFTTTTQNSRHPKNVLLIVAAGYIKAAIGKFIYNSAIKLQTITTAFMALYPSNKFIM